MSCTEQGNNTVCNVAQEAGAPHECGAGHQPLLQTLLVPHIHAIGSHLIGRDPTRMDWQAGYALCIQYKLPDKPHECSGPPPDRMMAGTLQAAAMSTSAPATVGMSMFRPVDYSGLAT